MKNVIKTIDLRDNSDLLGIACAMREISIMRKCGRDSGKEEPEPIKYAMDSIMELLHYKLQHIFIEDFSQYAENKFAIGEDSDGIKITVFDEKYDDAPEKCDDSVNISDMLKNSGLETSDDHVERLANDLRNKKGGLA